MMFGKVSVRDVMTQNTLQVNKTDIKYISGNLVHANKRTVLAKYNEQTITVSVKDPRFLLGELILVPTPSKLHTRFT